MPTAPRSRTRTTLAALLLGAALSPAWAAVQTVTLQVPGMTCAACPITIKKALSKVPGVRKVDVNLVRLEAVVSFDDSKASVADLTSATTNAGYPSSAKP
ncbi:MAG: mercury resistance system periplasmic binding protein MerP [Rhodoferax sp.]